MNAEQIIYLPTAQVKPYKKNPRKNKDAVDAVAASIKAYGFRSPIIIDGENTIINGHTRKLAAEKLGYKEVPCVRVTDLTEDQIKQYRLIDNKTSELASWDADLLSGELLGMDFGDLEFDFDFSGDLKKPKQWEASKARCNLKDRVALHKAEEVYYHSLFKAGKEGTPLKDLKVPENVYMFAETAREFIEGALGTNLDGWCILTTPRRRHGEGFHFATTVCMQLESDLQIPFYPDALITENRNRIDPKFSLVNDPPQHNVILYDDILSTGRTIQATRDLLLRAGHVVWTLISIDNH